MTKIITRNVKARIDGFDVELDHYGDGGEQRCDCFVSKGDWSGSLTLLEGTGHIDFNGNGQPPRGRDYEMDVQEKTIIKIANWANDNGY